MYRFVFLLLVLVSCAHGQFFSHRCITTGGNTCVDNSEQLGCARDPLFGALAGIDNITMIQTGGPVTQMGFMMNITDYNGGFITAYLTDTSGNTDDPDQENQPYFDGWYTFVVDTDLANETINDVVCRLSGRVPVPSGVYLASGQRLSGSNCEDSVFNSGLNAFNLGGSFPLRDICYFMAGAFYNDLYWPEGTSCGGDYELCGNMYTPPPGQYTAPVTTSATTPTTTPTTAPVTTPATTPTTTVATTPTTTKATTTVATTKPTTTTKPATTTKLATTTKSTTTTKPTTTTKATTTTTKATTTSTTTKPVTTTTKPVTTTTTTTFGLIDDDDDFSPASINTCACLLLAILMLVAIF